jgi:hypothetical protein
MLMARSSGDFDKAAGTHLIEFDRDALRIY